MSVTTSTATLQARLIKLQAAYDAVLTGQSYNYNGRMLTRANADWISSEIDKIEARLSRRGGPLSCDIVINPR